VDEESFIMTQPWEHGVEDLLLSSDYTPSGNKTNPDDDNICQIDGSNDELPSNVPSICHGGKISVIGNTIRWF